MSNDALNGFANKGGLQADGELSDKELQNVSGGFGFGAGFGIKLALPKIAISLPKFNLANMFKFTVSLSGAQGAFKRGMSNLIGGRPL